MKHLITVPLFALSACAMQGQGQLASNEGPNLQNVRVTTSPAGVTATSYAGYQCTTPCTLKLSSKKGGLITFEKPGYEVEQRFVTAGHGSARPARLFGDYGPLMVVPEKGPSDAMIQYRYYLDQPNDQFNELDVRSVSVTMKAES